MTDADEFLDWLCWELAHSGERFYPPEETAQECVQSVEHLYEEKYEGDELDLQLAGAFEWEKGQHSRALMEAREKFESAEQRGLNPVERAAREHRELMKKSEGMEPLDWSWYE
jgi:hypothetical protein